MYKPEFYPNVLDFCSKIIYVLNEATVALVQWYLGCLSTGDVMDSVTHQNFHTLNPRCCNEETIEQACNVINFAFFNLL